MPTFRRSISHIAVTFALALGAGVSAHAFDPNATFSADEEPREILRYGFQALRDGKMGDAMGAFRFGADKNDILAQWKLARMMQAGADGEPNHRGAVDLFRRIADRHGDRTPPPEDITYVSGALVALGLYALHGVEDSGVVQDASAAETFFFRAAALYHDPEAQYQLGALHRHGELGAPEPRLAARWLSLSARKGHPWAQAELGSMLLAGEGVPLRPVRGLVMLSRAAETLGPLDPLVGELQANAWSTASETERRAAETVLNATRAAGPSPYTTRRFAQAMGFPTRIAQER